MCINRPLISVLIPIYNASQYIENCVESLLRQSYSHIEILLVDDGSTDGSGSICDSYAIEDSRIKVFHIENSGPSHARNYGIEKATGEYLIFVDSDDYVESLYIEKLYSLISCDEIDLGICNYNEFTEKGNKYPQTLEKDLLDTLTGFVADDYNIIRSRFWVPWGKIYKLNIIKDNGITFPEDMVIAEDQIFNDAYLCHVNHYAYVDECLYNYRIDNGGSLSSKANLQTLYCDKKNLINKRTFLDDCNVSRKERILLDLLGFVAAKYNIIDNECIKYAIYDDWSNYTYFEKLKIILLKNHILFPFSIRAKMREFLRHKNV